MDTERRVQVYLSSQPVTFDPWRGQREALAARRCSHLGQVVGLSAFLPSNKSVPSWGGESEPLSS